MRRLFLTLAVVMSGAVCVLPVSGQTPADYASQQLEMHLTYAEELHAGIPRLLTAWQRSGRIADEALTRERAWHVQAQEALTQARSALQAYRLAPSPETLTAVHTHRNTLMQLRRRAMLIVYDGPCKDGKPCLE